MNPDFLFIYLFIFASLSLSLFSLLLSFLFAMNREQPNYNTTHYPYKTEPRFQPFTENPVQTEDFVNPTYRSIGLDEREKR